MALMWHETTHTHVKAHKHTALLATCLFLKSDRVEIETTFTRQTAEHMGAPRDVRNKSRSTQEKS